MNVLPTRTRNSRRCTTPCWATRSLKTPPYPSSKSIRTCLLNHRRADKQTIWEALSMPDQPQDKKIIVDTEWKEEAQREKEMLAEALEKEKHQKARPPEKASFGL